MRERAVSDPALAAEPGAVRNAAPGRPSAASREPEFAAVAIVIVSAIDVEPIDPPADPRASS